MSASPIQAIIFGLGCITAFALACFALLLAACLAVYLFECVSYWSWSTYYDRKEKLSARAEQRP